MEILTLGRIPDLWRVVRLCMVPKGDVRAIDPKEFRPIALMSYSRKLVEICVARYIQEKIDIRNSQFGYRKGAKIEVPVALIDAQMKKNPRLHHICLDISGVFDRTNLELVGVKIRQVDLSDDVKKLALILLNESSKMTCGGYSFWIDKGVAQ